MRDCIFLSGMETFIKDQVKCLENTPALHYQAKAEW